MNYSKCFIVVSLISVYWLSSVVDCFFKKFDLSHLPHDLLPVGAMVGHWELYTISGQGAGNFPFGRTIEFGIDPLPLFGARTLNYTAVTYDFSQPSFVTNGSFVTHFEYGVLLVNNKSRTNPQIQCSFLTTGSEGYSMTEFGLVTSPTSVKFFLNKYMSRSFDLNFPGGQFHVFDLSREFTMSENYLIQIINAKTTYGDSSFTVTYLKKKVN